MIIVSELAKVAILELLRARGIAQGQALRLISADERVGLEIDVPGDNDRVIHHRDSPVLIVDSHAERVVGDAMIDIRDEVDGYKLVLERIRRNEQLS